MHGERKTGLTDFGRKTVRRMEELGMVIDIAQGVAIEAQVAWQKGQEAGLKRTGQASLRGLIPSRLSDARAAWLRAGGR